MAALNFVPYPAYKATSCGVSRNQPTAHCQADFPNLHSLVSDGLF